MNEVLRVGRQAGFTAGQLDTFGTTLEGELIEHLDGVHYRFQFVEAICARAQNVQQQVDLAW